MYVLFFNEYNIHMSSKNNEDNGYDLGLKSHHVLVDLCFIFVRVALVLSEKLTILRPIYFTTRIFIVGGCTLKATT
jgi:hypothetical protein